jgi:arsenate reductase-like glutaredoxin family protein
MVETTSMIDARKTPIAWQEVRRIIRNVDDIYIAKGQKVIHIDLKTGKQEPEMLMRLLLRPSGNLRTPAFRRGRTLVVGFDEETYRRILGGV